MHLNIGCGNKILDNYLNIDKYPIDSSVMFGDLDSGIDLKDNCASAILLDNVIEHVASIEHALGEIYRLLKPNAEVTIITPHFSSASSWQDPTHRHHLSYFSFDFFSKKRSYLGNASFSVVSKKLSFGGGFSMIGRLIFLASPQEYERKFCFIFRASTLTAILRKI